MVFTIADGVTIEVSEASPLVKVLSTIEYAKAHLEHLKTHSYKDRDDYDFNVLGDLVDLTFYDDAYKEYHDLVWKTYLEVENAEDEAYREYAEADFLEFASHKGEEGFDWDMYSDWHKDLYGFRPRG